MAMDRKWVRRVGLYVAAWTVLALLSGVESYVSQSLYDKPISWDIAFRRSFKEWYSFGLLAIGILWLCNRVRLESGRAGRWFEFTSPRR
jgi:hypothetical protein